MIKRVRDRHGNVGDVIAYDFDETDDFVMVLWNDQSESWVNVKDVEVVK